MIGWRRSAAAGLLLLAVYVGLSFLNSPRGFLGTDTGAKVATLKVMSERGRFDPDIGYWAEEWDPDGSLHPLASTIEIEDRWVNVTTLPALWAGWQLYRLGGYRAALLVPMAGAVAAAFAAAALAKLLGATASWSARIFWLAGLASPLAIYALDFWEHSIGVALLAWSVVLVVGRRMSMARVAAAGAACGVAATMRTEALIYTAVIGAALVASRMAEKHVRRAVAEGASFGAAAAAVFTAGAVFERLVLAAAIRPSRAANTAMRVGEASSTRLEEAAVTTVAFGGRPGVGLGDAVTALHVIVSWRRIRGRFPLLAGGAWAATVGSYLVVIAGGLGFVPGLVPTAPSTVAASPIPQERRRHVLVVVIAVGAVPLVLLFQYLGGAGPQWGGRYLLPTSFLLAVAGWVRLAATDRRVTALFVGISVLITAYGLVWLQARSHAVERAVARIERRPEEVIVSSVGHLAREGGATYGERRWLTRLPGETAAGLTAVLDGAGVERVATVELRTDRPRSLPGFRLVERSNLELFPDVDLRITSWTRSH